MAPNKAKRLPQTWTCSECQAAYTVIQNLKYHVARLHPNKTDMIVNGRLITPKQKSVHLDPNKFKCSKCGRRFVSSSNLKYHQQNSCKMELQTVTWKCTECHAVVRELRTLQHHVARQHPTKTNMVVNCRRVIPKEKKRLVANAKKFKCRKCERLFASSSTLKFHQQNRCKKEKEVPLTWKCAECPAVYRQFTTLQLHVARQHPQKTDMIVNDRSMTSKERDEVKEAQKSPITNWQCTLCPAFYLLPRHLQSHVIHTHPKTTDMIVNDKIIIPLATSDIMCNTTKKLKCNKCKGCFVTASALEKHELICKGKVAQTWRCTDCRSMYADCRSLQYHLYYKHPSKTSMIVNQCRVVARIDPRRKRGPFKCHFCKTMHLTKDKLKLHIDGLHEGPNYKKFIQKQLFLQETKKQICEECCKPLRTLDTLRRHIATRHANLLPYNKNGIFIRKETFQHCMPKCCPFCPESKRIIDVPLHIKKKHVNKLPCFYKEKRISVSGIEKRFTKCPECHVSLEEGTTLQKHVRMCHSSMLPYKVDDNYEIDSLKSLKRMSVEHRLQNACQDVQHCCPKCEFSNVSLTAYFIHLKLNHGDLLKKELAGCRNVF